MVYQLPEIVKMVRRSLARGCAERPMIKCRDPDVVELDDLIRARIVQGVEKAYMEAPPRKLLKAARDFSHYGVYWHEPVDGTWSGHVELPEDFLRLIVFGMSDWSRPVYEAVDCLNPRYMLTGSRCGALRGTRHRPLAAIADMPEGKVLEFFSCGSAEAYIAQASYCPVPCIDEYGGIDIADSLIHDVAGCIASLVD